MSLFKYFYLILAKFYAKGYRLAYDTVQFRHEVSGLGQPHVDWRQIQPLAMALDRVKP